MEKWTRVNHMPGIGLKENGQRVTASAEHIALSKNAAKEGMVLLKNDRDVLPLEAGAKIALFGKATFDYVKGGGGSGDVNVSYVRNLYDGFKALGSAVTIFEELADFYRENVTQQYGAGCVPGLTKEPEVPTELLKKARAFTDTAIISICRFSGEGWDRCVAGEKRNTKGSDIFENGDFFLSHAEKAMVESVAAAFDKVIVVMNVGGMVDSCWFHDDDRIASVLMAWQGGMEGGLAAAELLTGRGTPSGKLTDTFARDLADYPSTHSFHQSDDYVEYTEDIYVGYRYFETIPGAAKRVNYPFGFGLSYTRFQLHHKELVVEDGQIRCNLTVTNVGEYPGKEVVQLYFQAPQGKLGKPARVLCAFQKTRLLQPGESQYLSLFCDSSDLASYDDTGRVCRSAYVLEKGEYHFYLGNSVADLEKLPQTYVVEEDRVVRQLSSRLAANQLHQRMMADGSLEALEMSGEKDTPKSILPPMPMEEIENIHPAIRGRERYNRKKVAHDILLNDVAEGKATLSSFVAQLSDEELIHLLGGQPNTGVANTCGFGNLPEYGVPNAMTADGPAGLRLYEKWGVFTTAWPCATLIACSWDPETAWQVGAAGGAEVKENNIGLWLTPGVNIHRSPLCGRNFEYYSEDPLVTGKMAAAMVRGIQSNHIGAAVKHFALNNKETNRKESDSRASERAIREIYLKGFEIIVKEADPWVIMSSYNRINGIRASENRDLLTGILRQEWGYTGMVTSDWWTHGEHYLETAAGNDVKMATGYPERVLEAYRQGAITRAELETSAMRILEFLLKLD